MKKTSSQLIVEAIARERRNFEAAERERILRLLKALGRGYGLASMVREQQAIIEAVKMVERNS